MRSPSPLLVALLLALPPPALARAAPRPRPRPAAQVATLPPLADSLRGEAKAAYDAGRILFADGDFSGALVKFKTAHAIAGDPRLLWNMAACEKNLRHYRRVRDLVEDYLEKGGAAGLLVEADRKEAKELLATLGGLIGAAQIKVNEPGARVSIDGEAVGTTPLDGEIEVDIGPRTIAVEKAGFRPFRATREVTGGAPLALDVTLERRAGRLEVKAEDKAAIAVDDRIVGQGSWSGELPPGRLMLRVTAPGKRPYEVEVSLDDRENRQLQVRLEDEPGGRRWLWVLGGAAIVGAAVASYFVFQPRTAPVKEGTLGTVPLPLRGGRP